MSRVSPSTNLPAGDTIRRGGSLLPRPSPIREPTTQPKVLQNVSFAKSTPQHRLTPVIENFDDEDTVLYIPPDPTTADHLSAVKHVLLTETETSSPQKVDAMASKDPPGLTPMSPAEIEYLRRYEYEQLKENEKEVNSRLKHIILDYPQFDPTSSTASTSNTADLQTCLLYTSDAADE